MLNSLKSKIAQNPLIRNSGILMGGTILAQSITFLALPVITRLYSPEDFSQFAIYYSIISILLPVACLRLDLLIPVARLESEAVNLIMAAITACALISCASFIALLLFSDAILLIFNDKISLPILLLIPLGVFLEGIYSTLQFWATREKLFHDIAKSKVAQTTGESSLQMAIGLFFSSSLGLVVGHIGKIFFGTTTLLQNMLQSKFENLKSTTRTSIFSEYKKNLKASNYSVLDALFNSAGSQVPILIIAGILSGPEVGFLMLAMKVSAAPMGLLGRNISQVYLSEAPAHLHNGTLNSLTAMIIGKLSLLGVPFIIVTGFTAPILFPVLFGPEWSKAGEILLWMTPWYVMSFLTVPVSMALQVTGNQHRGFYLQGLGSILRITAIVFAMTLPGKPLIELYAASGFIFYAVYLLVIVTTCKIKASELLKSTKYGFYACALATFIGYSLFEFLA